MKYENEIQAAHKAIGSLLQAKAQHEFQKRALEREIQRIDEQVTRTDERINVYQELDRDEKGKDE